MEEPCSVVGVEELVPASSSDCAPSALGANDQSTVPACSEAADKTETAPQSDASSATQNGVHDEVVESPVPSAVVGQNHEEEESQVSCEKTDARCGTGVAANGERISESAETSPEQVPAQDACYEGCDEVTAAVALLDAAASEGESSPDDARFGCSPSALDNGCTVVDPLVAEDDQSFYDDDELPAELVAATQHDDEREEVDGRGMPLSANDVESATGECDTKTDDGLQNINLDLGNIRQRFESPQESIPSVADRSALGRSESLLQRLEKYQSVAAGERNGDAHSESEDEDPSVVKETKAKEKVVYEGLSSLKSQWESGTVNSHQDRAEETKEELAKLRKKMCLGRSESMRQVYQKAVEDANRVQAGRAEQISVEGQEARATSIKEKFEAGVVIQETEAEKIERLQREKEEELSVFNETGIAHEAKNIFKQLDAEVARQSGAPTSLARSPSNRWNVPRPQNAVSPGEVVRASDPVREPEVATTEVSERFKFFENFKEETKERKRFEMTPPRDTGKEASPEFQVQRDPNVVRAADPAEEVIITDTARRMRERFRELEENASREELPQGPKPLKRITPPREYTRDNAHDASPEVQRDPDVVQCSYRVEDDIVIEADRAKSMRARFENWDAERVARENRRNGENADEECLPMADTAKTLKAKFEAIRDESERQEAQRPKPKVNRFVEFPGTPNSEACAICSKKLYPMERMEVSGLRMHKNCFRCSHCNCHLRLESYTISGGKLYCGPHFKQFFIAKGNYDEGFGREKWSRSASPASRESNEEYTNGDRDHIGILDQPVIA